MFYFELTNVIHILYYHFFVVGLKLKRWQNTPDGLRCWNQLKGRLLSKFSVSKFSTFNEIGLYHFILVFLTLAISADSQEMVGLIFHRFIDRNSIAYRTVSESSYGPIYKYMDNVNELIVRSAY